VQVNVISLTGKSIDEVKKHYYNSENFKDGVYIDRYRGPQAKILNDEETAPESISR